MLSITERIALMALFFTVESMPSILIVSGLKTEPRRRFFTYSLPCAERRSGLSIICATSFCPMMPLSTNVFTRSFIALELLKNESREPFPSISATIAPTSSEVRVLALATACSVLLCVFFSFLLNLEKVAVSYGNLSSVTSTRRGCPIPLCSICSPVKPKFSAFSRRSLMYSPSVPSFAAFCPAIVLPLPS